MMPDPKEELLARVATLLDALGPFPPGAKRDEKWRTTDRLANKLGLFGRDAVARSQHCSRIVEQTIGRNKSFYATDVTVPNYA